MYLIVGLGNPGEEYAKTRHNLGFMVIDELARRQKITNFKNKHQALLAKGTKMVLVKPQTFMNNSGQAVGQMFGWFKHKVEDLILIYDDVDLPVGEVRVRNDGGDGGHKGIKSVIAALKTTKFTRIRVGIGRNSPSGDVSDYVLSPIPKDQRELLDLAVVKAADAVESLCQNPKH